MSEDLIHSHDTPGALTRWQRWVGHSGYIAEGLLYLFVGFFALLAAVGRQQHPDGPKGSLARLGGSALGDALLVLLAIGLTAFVIWQLVLAIADPEHPANRSGPRRRLVRLGHLLNGLFHIVFVYEAVWSLLGLFHRDDEKETQVRWTARALTVPAGRFAVALIGVGILAFGFWQFYRAATREKDKRVDLSRTRLRILINALGVYGLAARGAVFSLAGGYLIKAVLRHDPRYSGGVAGALGRLKEQSYGEWLLAVAAVGLMCYGLCQVIKERYRRLGDS
ncbi:MAG TPA: DUF1206 domain-containing protein [Steroidobacteraceae bacterium]